MRSCLNGGTRLRRGGGGGGGGGRFTRGAAMYAKLFERRNPLTTGGGAVGKSHSLLKHKEHHGKRVHSAPALSCSTASLTFVRTTELSGLLSMAHTLSVDLCRREGGVGGGGGRQKLPGGGISYAMEGAAAPPPPKAMLDPGLERRSFAIQCTYATRRWLKLSVLLRHVV